MSSITLNGRTYSADDFKGYGYTKQFPEQIFTDLLAELELRGVVRSVLRVNGVDPDATGNVDIGTIIPAVPDHVKNYALVSIGGVQSWLELVEIAGGVAPTNTDGNVAATGHEIAGERNPAVCTGSGGVIAVGAEAICEVGQAVVMSPGQATGVQVGTETGYATPTGLGQTTAVGVQSGAEAGTATAIGGGQSTAAGNALTAEAGSGSAAGQGRTVATGSEVSAEMGQSSVFGSGSTSTTSHELTSQSGTATAAAVQDGTAAALSAEIIAEVGTSSASTMVAVNATGTEITVQLGAATGSGAGISTAAGTEVTAQANSATAAGQGTVSASGPQTSSETGASGTVGQGNSTAAGTELSSEAGTATASGVAAPGQVLNANASTSPPQITVTWTDTSSETSYELFYATAAASNNGANLTAVGYDAGNTAYPGVPDATAGHITGIAAGTTTYTLNGLTPTVTYYIKVAARNSGGLGPISAAAAAAAPADFFGSSFEGWVPVNFSLETLGGNSVAHAVAEGWDDDGTPSPTEAKLTKDVALTVGQHVQFSYKATAGDLAHLFYFDAANSIVQYDFTIDTSGQWVAVSIPIAIAQHATHKTVILSFWTGDGLEHFLDLYLDNIMLA